jgi:E3 ubiquitin-protein ligase UBR7
LSLEELGLRALQRLPRERTINSIHAFNEMRSVTPAIPVFLANYCSITTSDQLMSHLRPFAEQDKEVTEADIKAFFEAKMAEKHA